MNEKKPVSNVCYQIAAKNGRVLEVADFNTASGAAVQLWDNVKGRQPDLAACGSGRGPLQAGE